MGINRDLNWVLNRGINTNMNKGSYRGINVCFGTEPLESVCFGAEPLESVCVLEQNPRICVFRTEPYIKLF